MKKEAKNERIILDGVFSYTGADSRYFNKFFSGDLLFATNPSEEDEIITISGEFVIICNNNGVEIVNEKLIITKHSNAVLLRKSR